MDLQLAINAATPGATIQIPDNERCVGNFVIDKALTIIGGVDSKILAAMGNEFPAIYVPPGTGPVVLRKLNITVQDSVMKIGDIIRFGGATLDTGQISADKCPQGLWLDGCDVFGRPNLESQRGISANGLNLKITKSKVREIHARGYDTQAVCSWNGPGPFTFEDSYFEAAGENVMFGGSPPIISGLIHQNIVIRRCVFFKPQSWRGVWTVKNLFELKNARNVLVDGCVFDGCWTDAQTGRALQFTPRPSDSGLAALIEDVQFLNSVIRNTGAGANILGADESNNGTVPTDTRLKRLRIANCVFEIDGAKFGSDGVFLVITNKTEDVTVENCTVVHTGNVISSDYAPNTGFVYRSNISRHNTYGVFGSGMSTGNPSLQQYFPGAVFTGNVMTKEGVAPSNVETLYPTGNFFPTSLAEVGFVDLAAGDYHLIDSSPYKGAGADIEAIKAAQGGTTTTPLPTPPPPAPEPTPTPIPEPTPAPPPAPCAMTISVVPPVLTQWGTGKLVVTLTGLTDSATVRATASSGQITVTPASKSVTGTSAIIEFRLQAKKKSSSITITGPCGTQIVPVPVK
jgi:hypothetical protein